MYKHQKLGSWVTTQRRTYALQQGKELDASSSRMSEQRISLLNDIGFVWDRKSAAQGIILGAGSKWDQMFQLLKDYATEHSHVSPHRVETYRGQRLGNWVYNQRRNYKRRQKRRLSSASSIRPDRQVTLLNDIDFIWDLNEAGKQASVCKGSRWDFMYQLLKEFFAEHNHRYPFLDELYKGHSIDVWVVKQQYNYRRRQKGLLSSSSLQISDLRICRLNDIGFDWQESESRQSRWDLMYNLLKDYSVEHNTIITPQRLLYKGQHLGSWVSCQRHYYKRYKKGQQNASAVRLTDQRVALLEEIGFALDPEAPKPPRVSVPAPRKREGPKPSLGSIGKASQQQDSAYILF